MSRYSDLAKMKSTPAPEDKPIVADKSTDVSVKPSKDTPSAITPSLHQSITTSAFGTVHTDDVIAAIHKSLRDAGSTLGSYRISPMEKKRLEVTVFELKNRSIVSTGASDLKTNENDLVRISLNWIINDYKANGDDSVLVKALISLRA